MYRYSTIEESFDDEELGNYISYGITVRSNGETIMTISDMSLNRELVDELVSRCNSLQLDPLHLYDVIEDAIG